MKLGGQSTPIRRSGGVSLTLKVAILFIAVFLGVGASYAYFTAKAASNGELYFANINADFVTSTDQVYTTELLNKQLSKIKPGDKVQLSNIYVKNIGDYDIYALLEIQLDIFKLNQTEASESFTSWYNLTGTQITGDVSTTTVEATLLASSSKTAASISVSIPSSLGNEYKSGSAKLTANAHVIQSLLKAETGVSTAVTASRLIYQNKDNPDVENTVYIRPNGGSYNNSSDVTTVSQDRGSTITLGTPTRTGYTFSGWSFTGDGSLNGSTYTFGKSVGTITAEWQANTYNVFLNQNDDANPNLLLSNNTSLGGETAAVEYDETTNTLYGKASGSNSYSNRKIQLFKNKSDYLKGLNYSNSGNRRYTTIQVDGTFEYIAVGFNGSTTDAKVFFDISHLENGTYLFSFKDTNTYPITSGSLSEFKIEKGSTLTTYTVPSKSVEYDGLYGTLPTPTREGYTFNGWLGASIVPDLSMWTLHYGATYNATTGELYLPNINSYVNSGLIPVNNLKSLYVYTEVMSEYSDALGYISVDYFTSTKEHYNNNGSAQELSNFGINAGEYGWQRHLYGGSTQLLEDDCYYVSIWIYRSDTYAPQPYYVRNVQISTESTLTKTYITSSTQMTTAANHALVADWTKNETTSTTSITKENEQTSSQIENQTIVLPSKQKWVE